MKSLKTILFLVFVLTCNYNAAYGSYKWSLKATEATNPINKAYLTVIDVFDEGQVLVLDDGSEWEIKYYGGLWKILGWGWTEQKEVSHWSVGDTIEVLLPSSGNILDFVLSIRNLSKKEGVLAKPKKSPSVDFANCLWVADVDHKANLITTNDGRVWKKSNRYDMYGAFFKPRTTPLREWCIGDILTLMEAEEALCFSDYTFLWNRTINEMPVVYQID